MKKKVRILFMPVIYKDDGLNEASARIGTTECLVSGKKRNDLFGQIRQKIWAMSSEASILDEEVAREYNRWVSDVWRAKDVPAEVNNIMQRDMRYALPYSQEFKQWLRRNN